VKELTPLELIDFGKVKRVRGTAVSCRIPPSSAARVAHSAKGVMHRLLPDVWIHTDVHSSSGKRRKFKEGGDTSGCGPSPGLSVLLTATTTEGICLASECSMNHNVGSVAMVMRMTATRMIMMGKETEVRRLACVVVWVLATGIWPGQVRNSSLVNK